MAILFKSTPAATARWRPFLASAWPDRELRYWPEIGDKSAIDYALVWHPEPGLLASLPARYRYLLPLADPVFGRGTTLSLFRAAPGHSPS